MSKACIVDNDVNPPEIAQRRLVPLLTDWSPEHQSYYLYYSGGRQLPLPLKLFIEFMISEYGQAIARDAGYIPANPKVAAKVPRLKPEAGHFEVLTFTPELFKTRGGDWIGIYRDLFP